MTKTEIAQYAANVHNLLVASPVTGEATINVGKSIELLRALLTGLQKDIEEEEKEKNGSGEANERA